MKAIALLVLGALAVGAAEPGFGASSVSLGAGLGLPGSGYRTYAFHNGASFAAEYEVRLHRFAAATIGIDNLVMNVDQYGRNPLPPMRERLTLMPFGVRAVLPARGRVDFMAGTGGAALWTSDSTLGSSYGRDSLLWQLNGGARIAVGSGRRFRIGPSARFYRDLSRPTQEWVSLTFDLQYRFGR